MGTTDQFTELIEQIADDPKAMSLFGRVLETTQAQRHAIAAFREYWTPDHDPDSSATTSKSKSSVKRGRRPRSGSLTQRAFAFLTESGGKPVSTKVLAQHVNATEPQVRGAFKKFVREKRIIKPRRGFWQYVEGGRLNGKASSIQHPSS